MKYVNECPWIAALGYILIDILPNSDLRKSAAILGAGNNTNCKQISCKSW